jgi:ABC-2 type transport system permease protein
MTRVSGSAPLGSAARTPGGSAPAPLLRRIMLQGQYETITMLRNGEQLILAIVLPLLAMVGLTVTPLLDGLGSSRINVAVPGILALCAMSCVSCPPLPWAAPDSLPGRSWPSWPSCSCRCSS